MASPARTEVAILILYHVTDTPRSENSQHFLVSAFLQTQRFTQKSVPALPGRFERLQAAVGLLNATLVARQVALPNRSIASAVLGFLCRNGVWYITLCKVGEFGVNLNHVTLRSAQLASRKTGICWDQIEESGHNCFVIESRAPD